MNEKEYDAPMHSAEHLLNQTMNRMFGCGRTFSSHIERKKSKCDYHISRPLTDEELRQIEETVNKVIAQQLNVTEHFITRDEAEKAFNLSRLPESAGDNIRIVRIGDYDACPCIGPHVENTRQIGRFVLLSSDYLDGVVRIRFKRISETV
jgi:alanyl-tRNA synthetase